MLQFIFDLDDTLIATSEVFDRAQQTFFDEMERLGFNRDAAVRAFLELDRRNIKRWGFMPRRFYASMGETYEALCRLQGTCPDPETRKRLESTGRRVFTTPPRVIEGSAEVLDMLTRRGDLLLLWTKGDEGVQKHRLTWSGLGHFFREVHVFEQKTKSELEQIVQAHRLPLSTTWVVGDAIRSDINPALEVGANAIWIAGPSWDYEYVQPVRGHYLKLSDISEILLVYPTLTAR